MTTPTIEWWKPGRVIEEARCTWVDWFDALFGKRETFARIELDGSWCIVERIEAWSFMYPTDPGHAHTITEVRMTRRQFDNLPEFEGF